MMNTTLGQSASARIAKPIAPPRTTTTRNIERLFEQRQKLLAIKAIIWAVVLTGVMLVCTTML